MTHATASAGIDTHNRRLLAGPKAARGCRVKCKGGELERKIVAALRHGKVQ